MSPRIEIVEPRPAWADDFVRLRTALRGVLPAGSAIHHIGSTAVPGLAAKDVIDIQVTAERLTDVDPAALAAQGFVHASHLVEDHCPPGMDLEAGELRKLFFRCATRPAHVHVRERGRFNQRYALLCRDFLRAHPIAAQAYGEVKQRLAEHFADNNDAYYDIKDPVFDIIMAGAEAWATLVEWVEPPPD